MSKSLWTPDRHSKMSLLNNQTSSLLGRLSPDFGAWMWDFWPISHKSISEIRYWYLMRTWGAFCFPIHPKCCMIAFRSLCSPQEFFHRNLSKTCLALCTGAISNLNLFVPISWTSYLWWRESVMLHSKFYSAKSTLRVFILTLCWCLFRQNLCSITLMLSNV